MERNNERGTRAKKRKVDTNINIDRLSSLPDAILVSILRLLPLETAVSTSVLSTQWRNLWIQVTSIKLNKNINGDNFFAVCTNILFKLTSLELNLVDLKIPIPLVFPRNQEPFHQMCFYYLDVWIPLISNRSIKNFSISVDKPLARTPKALISLPSSLVKCQSLVTLVIEGGFKFPSINNTGVCFPNLKRLQMHLFLRDDQQHEFVANVLKGCPILNYLLIEEYGFEINDHRNNQRCLFISAHKLKTLFITLRTPKLYGKVLIDTPKLGSIHLHDTSLARYTFVDTPKKLAKGALRFSLPNRRIYGVNLLKSISSSLESLDFYYYTFGSFAYYLDHRRLPVLSNLKTFKVNRFVSNFCNNLMKFLQNCCPNLRTLDLRLTPSRVGQVGALDCHPAPCLLTKVTRISIKNLEPSKDELELVKYFQRNSRVLKVLHLVVGCAKARSVCFQQERKEYEFCRELFKGSDDNNVGCTITFTGKSFNVTSEQGEIEGFASGNLGNKFFRKHSRTNYLVRR